MVMVMEVFVLKIVGLIGGRNMEREQLTTSADYTSQ
jgi:hypothetical protein